MKNLINIFWKLPVVIFMFLTPFLCNAQTTTSNSDLFTYALYAVCAIAIIAAIVVIQRIMNLMVRMKEIEIYNKHGLTEYLNQKNEFEGSWWKYIQGKMTRYVPLDQEKEILFDHEYDGIRELDNNLPPWWLYGFYLSIVFAVLYLGYYHVFDLGLSSAEEYELEMVEAEESVALFLSQQADLIDENSVTLLDDEESLTLGKEIFEINCVACHLSHGGGAAMSVGPNLTDKYWLHGGSIKDVFTTVKYGVPDKGMISWQSQLRPVEMHRVSSYILSLQGTNPPDAKEPQGELYEPSEEINEEEVNEEQ